MSSAATKNETASAVAASAGATHWEAMAAIDFGSARSGYAVGTSTDRIMWDDEFDGNLTGAGKVPTVICTRPDGSFYSFGNLAVRDYNQPEIQDLVFYCYFKMLLYFEAATKEWERTPPSAAKAEETKAPTSTKAEETKATTKTEESKAPMTKRATDTSSSPVKATEDPLDTSDMMKKNPYGYIMATAIDGVSQCKLLTLITYALRELSGYAMARLRRMGKSPSTSNIRWVLTVPAIWNPLARDFMREAAKAAGFFTSDSQLLMCQESDAATFSMQKELNLAVGSRVMVADLGGGTADFTVHDVVAKKAGAAKELVKFGEEEATAAKASSAEKNDHYQLSEVVWSSGGAWGSMYIDLQFVHMMDDIFGKVLMDGFRNTCAGDWYRLLNEFELRKHEEYGIRARDTPVIIRLPASLSHHLALRKETLAQKCKQYSDTHTPVVSGWFSSAPDPKEAPVVGKDATNLHLATIRISRKQFNAFAQPVVDRTIAHVERIFKQILAKTDAKEKAPFSHLVLTGGLAECKPMMQAFEAWVAKLDAPLRPILYRPPQASVSVLRGAVQFGFNTRLVSARIMPWHYGYVSSLFLNASRGFGVLHPIFADPTVTIHVAKRQGQKKHLFTSMLVWLTERGVSYPVDHAVHEKLAPSHDRQTETIFHIYKSETRDKILTSMSDPKCTEWLGAVKVPCPDSDMDVTQRGIDLYMQFSGTEFRAAAREISAIYSPVNLNPWDEYHLTSRPFTRATFQYEGPKAAGSEPEMGTWYEDAAKLPARNYVLTLTTLHAFKEDAGQGFRLQFLGEAKVHDFDQTAHFTHTLTAASLVLPTYCIIKGPHSQAITIFYLPAVGVAQVADHGRLAYALSSLCLSEQ